MSETFRYNTGIMNVSLDYTATINFDCPSCGAKVGWYCVTKAGHVTKAHKARRLLCIEAARKAFKDMAAPACEIGLLKYWEAAL